MNELALHDNSAEQLLGTVSLQHTRAVIQAKLRGDVHFTWFQKRRILRELDHLIECEDRRRHQKAAHQLEQDEFEHRTRIEVKKNEVHDQTRLALAKTHRDVAQLHRQRVAHHVRAIDDIMLLLRKYKCFAKPDNSRSLKQQQLDEQLARRRERMLHSQILRRALSRAQFIRLVREKFPELAEELIDHYDQQMFVHNERNHS